jgi:hypothetical protein
VVIPSTLLWQRATSPEAAFAIKVCAVILANPVVFAGFFQYSIYSGGIIMGLVYTEVTLKNAADVSNVRRGILKDQEVRQKTVQAMVDTGCFTLVINETIRQELGLEVEGDDVATLANESREICKVTEPLAIHWKDRHTALPALVLANAKEVLLVGRIVVGVGIGKFIFLI